MLLVLLAFAPAFALVLYGAYEQRQPQQAEVRNAITVLAREVCRTSSTWPLTIPRETFSAAPGRCCGR